MSIRRQIVSRYGEVRRVGKHREGCWYERWESWTVYRLVRCNADGSQTARRIAKLWIEYTCHDPLCHAVLRVRAGAIPTRYLEVKGERKTK